MKYIYVLVLMVLLLVIGILLVERQQISTNQKPIQQPDMQAEVPEQAIVLMDQPTQSMSIQERQEQIFTEMNQRMEEQRLQSARDKQADLTRSYLEQRLAQEQRQLEIQQQALRNQALMQQQGMGSNYGPQQPSVQIYQFNPNPHTDAARARAINSRTDQVNRDNFIQNKMPHRAAYERRARERD